MRTNRLLQSAFLFTVTVAAGLAVADEPTQLTLADIIEKVAAEEQRYADIDVYFETDYTFAKQLHKVAKDAALRFDVAQASNKKVHFVRQADKFRMDRWGNTELQTGDTIVDRVRIFDGAQTRVVEGENNHAVAGRVEDDCCLRPHMAFIKFLQYGVPLATYMSGYKAMELYPASHWHSHKLDVRYEGTDKVDNLKCHVVTITTLLEQGQTHDMWKLWLAEDRNMIPARIEGYTFRVSRTVPVGEGTVRGWREISHGVWFPAEIEFTAFDQQQMVEGGGRDVQWTDVIRVKKVALSPSYPDAYFSNIASTASP